MKMKTPHHLLNRLDNLRRAASTRHHRISRLCSLAGICQTPAESQLREICCSSARRQLLLRIYRQSAVTEAADKHGCHPNVSSVSLWLWFYRWSAGTTVLKLGSLWFRGNINSLICWLIISTERSLCSPAVEQCYANLCLRWGCGHRWSQMSLASPGSALQASLPPASSQPAVEPQSKGLHRTIWTLALRDPTWDPY